MCNHLSPLGDCPHIRFDFVDHCVCYKFLLLKHWSKLGSSSQVPDSVHVRVLPCAVTIHDYKVSCAKYYKLEVHGRARREAARRRKSECKVNLLSQNSSRSNDSWRIAKSTKYSAAAIARLAGAADGAATNEAAPLTRATQNNTLLIKMTHDSTPVCLDVVRMTSDILTSPEVIRAQTLHFEPNFKFSRLKILGGPLSQLWCALASLGQSVTHVKI